MKKILILLVLPILASAQQFREFSVVSYNSLRYSPSNIDARHPHFRVIMDDMQPDLLLMQELSGAGSPKLFLDSVLNRDSTTYQMAPFSDGYDLDAALFYKSGDFSILNTTNHTTQLRDIFEYQVLPVDSKDTLTIYTVHLKASSGSTNEARRAAEVAQLRQVTDQLADSSNFLVCGDFNIYGSDEPAYQDLIKDTPGNQGHFVDVIQMSGTWNNPNYAQHHTQSPRTTRFNGGAHGGMDDRFDMILFSEALVAAGGMDFIDGTMEAYGNDGQHYNKAIVDAPANTAVSAGIAQALHLASDHLPVRARIQYELKSGLSAPHPSVPVLEVFGNGARPRLHNPKNLSLDYQVLALDGQLIQQGQVQGDHQFELKPGKYMLLLQHQGEFLQSCRLSVGGL